MFNFFMQNYAILTILKMNKLIHDAHFKKHDTLTGRPPPNHEKLWFPTPETCSDLSDLTPLQRDIYDQILFAVPTLRKDESES